jgi:iron complex outermembrane receptor protein
MRALLLRGHRGRTSFARVASLAVWVATASLAGRSAAEDVDVPTLPPVSVTATATVPDKYQLPGTTVGVTATQMDETINVVNTEDALKYLPSIVIRKRHIGDVQDPIQTRTSGLGQSARSLIYADGMLLSALIGNNNASASPRWGMVSPSEIDRIDVMYGPFAAAYPGNSMGAVVEITTHMPQKLEASANVLGATQSFKIYGTSDTYNAFQADATLGNRVGDLSYFLSANYIDSRAQPLAIVTALRPAAPSNAGTVVTGAYADQNRTGMPIVDIGAGGFEHQTQGNYKVKIAYDFTPTLRGTYAVGWFHQNDDATVQSYMRDAAGNPVYSGNLNIFGYNYNIPASSFSNNYYRLNEDLVAQSVALRSSTGGALDWEAVVSNFDWHNSTLRTPTVAIPAAQSGGAGIITSMDGTGWWNADLKGFWRPQGASGDQQVTFGAHYDRYVLASPKYLTDNWMSGGEGALSSDARGKTQTSALWLQDVWRFDSSWTATLGARHEWWRAFDGFNYSLAPPLAVNQPELSASKFSPKSALSWQATPEWLATGLFGVAYRFRTVTELYQVITTGPTLTVPNPFLKPEHAISAEIALERTLAKGKVRLSVFQENLQDALIAQTAPLVPGSTTPFNYVQNVERIKSQGAELVANVQDFTIPGLELSGSATYVHSRVLEDPTFPAAVGKQTPNIPPWRWTATAIYRPDDELTATLALRYSNRVYATLDNSDTYTHTYQGFDSFLVADARINYRFDKSWSAALGVDNLNNRRYFLFHPFPQQTVLGQLSYRF